jgi:hypothetical protein
MLLRLQIGMAIVPGAATSALVAGYAKVPAPLCIVPAHPCGGTSGFACGQAQPCPGAHVRWLLVLLAGLAVALLALAIVAVRHRQSVER